MDIKECTNKEEWKKHEDREFLQSWDWGEFQQSVGHRVLRLQILEEGKVVGQIQGVVHNLGLGMKYLYFPRIQNSEFRIQNVIDFLNKEKFLFIRLEGGQSNINLHSAFYTLHLVKNRQPAQTLILDLEKEEVELLGQMHPKTRYNIHLAVRKGVTVKEEKNVDIFWQLNKKTTERDEFKSHNKNYYEQMLAQDFSRQLIAYYNNQPIASNILVVSNGVCTYLHGASGNESRNLMAPYLLQWEGIKSAKNLSCDKYDFWGVAPKAEEGNGQSTCFHKYCWEVNHRWTGVTRFKAGFGGTYVEYPKAVEIPLDGFKYKIYRLLRSIR